MKYLIFSDLHGSYTKAQEMMDIFSKQNCDRIIFLGDLLYHGPRNDLPENYAPKKVVEIIKPYIDKFIFIKGNCDAEVDEMVLQVSHPFEIMHTIDIGSKKVHFTHGHHLSRFEPDVQYGKEDVIVYGHYHTFDYHVIHEATYINVGSITLPKDKQPGYAILKDSTMIWFHENGKILASFDL